MTDVTNVQTYVNRLNQESIRVSRTGHAHTRVTSRLCSIRSIYNWGNPAHPELSSIYTEGITTSLMKAWLLYERNEVLRVVLRSKVGSECWWAVG